MAEQKFDFQNMDIKLYTALKAVLPYAEAEMQSLYETARRDSEPQTEADLANDAVNAANLALTEFEVHLGPIPEWASGRNWDYSLVPGAQLCTKDGRRTGNAHIIKHGKGIAAGPVFVPTFELLTDAGNKFIMTEQEIETAFYVGDWISDPAEVLKKFDREGVFKPEPK